MANGINWGLIAPGNLPQVQQVDVGAMMARQQQMNLAQQQQSLNAARFGLEQQKFGLEQQMFPAEKAYKEAAAEATLADAQMKQYALRQQQFGGLMSAVSGIFAEPDENMKQQRYAQVYKAAESLGYNPQQFGLTPVWNEDNKNILSVIQQQYQQSQQAAMSDLVGKGTETIVDPQTGKPRIVPKVAAIGQTPYEKTSIQEAQMISGLQASKAELPRAWEILFPGGKRNKFDIITAQTNFPWTEGKEARQIIERAIENRIRAASGAAVPETEIKRYMDMFMPHIGDSDAGIIGKKRSFFSWMNQLENLRGVDYDRARQVMDQNAQMMLKVYDPATVAQFRKDNPEFKNRTDDEISNIIYNKIQRQNISQRNSGGIISEAQAAPFVSGTQAAKGQTSIQQNLLGNLEDKPIGYISALHESNNNPASVAKDNIGWAYGVYQFNSQGKLSDFLNKSGYKDQFAGMRPGTESFNMRWKQLAQTDPDFANSQHQYVKQNVLQPISEKAQAYGFNTQDRKIQEALLSMGIQHGKADVIIAKAGKLVKDGEDPLKALYKARGQYVMNLKLSPGLKKQQLSRYRSEYTQLANL